MTRSDVTIVDNFKSELLAVARIKVLRQLMVDAKRIDTYEQFKVHLEELLDEATEVK